MAPPGPLGKYAYANNFRKGTRRKKAQPFWNDELADLWADRCLKERQFSHFKCKNKYDQFHKRHLRILFKISQNAFDKNLDFTKGNIMLPSFKN